MRTGFLTDPKRSQTILPESYEDYKQERALYAYNRAVELGFDDNQSRWLVAQIIRENGAMNERVRGDKGCSVGLTQWNECARGKNPAGYDWKAQIDLFLSEIRGKSDVHDFYVASVSWNAPSVMKDKKPSAYKYYHDVKNVYNNLF